MKKGILLGVAMVLMLVLGGCGEKTLEGDCKCVIKLAEFPKELKMLEENIAQELYVGVRLQNIYTEEDMSITLTADEDFQEKISLKPGTYKITSCYAGPSSLLPMEVEAGVESIQLKEDSVATLDIAITNLEVVQDWIWQTNASREVLEAGEFSHMVQFEGQMIDLKQITEYVSFQSEEQIRPGKRLTISCKDDKGVSITVINEGNEMAGWQNCKLLEVNFRKNNIVWGQGACIGMNVTEAVHAETGLYGKPDSMAGGIMVGMGQESTSVSWIDDESGDKLTLTMTASGDYISGISYAFEVYE